MNKAREGVLAYDVRLTPGSSTANFTLTIPFGNSSKKRFVKEVRVLSKGDNTAIVQILTLMARCEDFILNYNNDASAVGSVATTVAQLPYMVSNNAGAGGQYLQGSVITMDQPWVASDLNVFCSFRYSGVVATEQVYLINVIYEEVD